MFNVSSAILAWAIAYIYGNFKVGSALRIVFFIPSAAGTCKDVFIPVLS